MCGWGKWAAGGEGEEVSGSRDAVAYMRLVCKARSFLGKEVCQAITQAGAVSLHPANYNIGRSKVIYLRPEIKV